MTWDASSDFEIHATDPDALIALYSELPRRLTSRSLQSDEMAS